MNQGKDVDWNIQVLNMSEKSRQIFNEYSRNVLNRSRMFLEDMVESEEVIQLEKEIYQVSKFMMVTINLLEKNLLVCDDKQSVSFINPLNMQKIATIPLPNEGAYLYSAYLNKTNKTVFMGFDNKKIIGVDSERYTNKSTMSLEIACLKFA